MNYVAWRSAYMGKYHQWLSEHPSPELPDRYAIYERLIEAHSLGEAITYLEFGVHEGRTIRWWTERNQAPGSRFVGFDSFEGLPEDWHRGCKKGTFSTDGTTPDISDERCSFQVGWFKDTLADFVDKYPFGHRNVIHIDADLYSSTLLVLCTLAPKLKPGDVLIFDEFADKLHEFRAFIDFEAAYQIPYRVLAHAAGGWKVALELCDRTE